MLLLWLTTAFAAPCPDVSAVVDEAWAAFNDAELAIAKEHLGRAFKSLTCQERLVTKEELLELYRLDGLVSVAQEDRKGAQYATIRIVTVDPAAFPGQELGPMMSDLHETWSGRLADVRIKLTVAGQGEAWVDGRAVDAVGGLDVVAGEHLVQGKDASGWHATLVEIDEDTRVDLGSGLTLTGLGERVPGELPLEKPPPEVVPKKKNSRRVALLIGGSAGAAIGGGLIAYAYTRERAFKDDPYTDPDYGGCNFLDACYDDARDDAIHSEARTIRALYGTGYGLVGVGVGLVGAELFLLPDPARGGGMALVRVKW